MLTVILPWPPSELSPNRKNGRHWGQTHSAKVKYLADCRVLTLQAMRSAAWAPPVGTLPLVITFAQPDKRRRDRDNLLAAIKSGLDGVSQALGVDDQHFDPITIRREYSEKLGVVVLEIDA